MKFTNALSGGWGQSAGNRGFREIEPVCKPGPNFDSCSRDQLIGTGVVVFAVALFVGLSGFVVWFVVTDQWVCPWRQDSFAVFSKATLTRSQSLWLANLF